jgi:hypothetical protein
MTPVAAGLHAVFEFLNAVLAGAMRTAIEDTLTFHAVPDHTAAAVGAGGRQGMDRAFKAIEHVRLPAHAYFKAFVVYVTAHFTSHLTSISHGLPLSLSILIPTGRLVLS